VLQHLWARPKQEGGSACVGKEKGEEKSDPCEGLHRLGDRSLEPPEGLAGPRRSRDRPQRRG
jgi:hypothetical protein